MLSLALCSRVVVVLSPFRIMITSLGEERAGLCSSRAFVWLFCTRWFLSFSSWCQGLAAVCECDTPCFFSINLFSIVSIKGTVLLSIFFSCIDVAAILNI